jgi:hypothetical protein
VEACLEETFVEAVLKFVSLLPLHGFRPNGASANASSGAEQVLHAMLKSAQDNTDLNNSGSTTSGHRWCALLSRLMNMDCGGTELMH